MKRFVMLLPPLLAAACNSGPAIVAANASVEEAAQKVEAARAGEHFMSPGRWEGTVSVESLDMPGMEKMPSAIAEKMKAGMMKGRSFRSCVTAEDAKAPKAGMFGGDRSCRYERFVMAGGTIDAAMACDAAGETRRMTIQGSYSPDAYHAEIRSTGTERMAGGVALTVDAKRSGACTGDEDG